jgi:archaellum component FlaC
MKLKYLLENFETMTIKDLAANYDGLKTNIGALASKINDISSKYSGKIEIEQIPTLMQEISEVIAMLQ